MFFSIPLFLCALEYVEAVIVGASDHASLSSHRFNSWRLGRHRKFKPPRKSRFQKRNIMKLIPSSIHPEFSDFINKDGNCFFRAISHLLYGSQDGHIAIRQNAVQVLKTNHDIFLPLTEAKDINKIISKQSRLGQFAEREAIQATADSIGRDIILYHSRERGYYEFTSEKDSSPQSPLYLYFDESFHHYEVYHYI